MGHMLLAGPSRDQEAETERALCVFRTSIAETKRLVAEGDPSVRAGRTSVEAMTWQKGALG